MASLNSIIIPFQSNLFLFCLCKFYIGSFLDSGECCAARSVHLRFQPDVDECVDLFYNEVTVERTTPGSYFMICGWSCGYFGIQQLTEDMNHNNKVVYTFFLSLARKCPSIWTLRLRYFLSGIRPMATILIKWLQETGLWWRTLESASRSIVLVVKEPEPNWWLLCHGNWAKLYPVSSKLIEREIFPATLAGLNVLDQKAIGGVWVRWKPGLEVSSWPICTRSSKTFVETCVAPIRTDKPCSAMDG